MRLLAQKLVLLAATVLVPILLLELALRMIGYVPGYGDPTIFSVTGDAREFGLTPNWSGLYAGAMVRTNSLGLRGPELTANKRSDEYRVLILGDSVTFGQGVGDKEIFPARLQAMLQARRGFGEVTVVNAGVPGYNTTSQLEQLKQLWPIVQPDLVILAYLIDNDSDLDTGIRVDSNTGELVTGFYQSSLTSRTSYFLHRHSRLYNFLRHRIRILLLRAGTAPEINTQDMFSSQNPGWEASRRALLEIKTFCMERGVPFFVGGVGLILRLQGMDSLTLFCKWHGLTYVELWRTSDVKAYYAEYAVSPYEHHPNPRAHEIIASRLASYLSGEARGRLNHS